MFTHGYTPPQVIRDRAGEGDAFRSQAAPLPRPVGVSL